MLKRARPQLRAIQHCARGGSCQRGRHHRRQPPCHPAPRLQRRSDVRERSSEAEAAASDSESAGQAPCESARAGPGRIMGAGQASAPGGQKAPEGAASESAGASPRGAPGRARRPEQLHWQALRPGPPRARGASESSTCHSGASRRPGETHAARLRSESHGGVSLLTKLQVVLPHAGPLPSEPPLRTRLAGAHTSRDQRRPSHRTSLQAALQATRQPHLAESPCAGESPSVACRRLH